MDTTSKTTITVTVTVNAPAHKVWDYWTLPEHITQWNFAANSWECPSAVNHVKPGGNFSWRMAAKDGSMAFDYAGTYDAVTYRKAIDKTLGDGRKVHLSFEDNGETTTVTETFEPENINPLEMQRMGWLSILENFKKHTENN